MRLEIRKTGPYGFGLMYHVIHLADDVSALNDLDRHMLKESCRVARQLQQRVALDYQR